MIFKCLHLHNSILTFERGAALLLPPRTPGKRLASAASPRMQILPVPVK
jgi:hypothetical protein